MKKNHPSGSTIRTQTFFFLLFGIGILFRCGVGGALDLETLLENIRDENSEVRVEAARKADEVGAEAVVPLGKLLTHEDQFVVKDVKHALRNIVNHSTSPGAEKDREAIANELVKLTGEGNPPVTVREALYLLGWVGNDSHVPAAARCLSDPEVREEAVRCLHHIPGEAATKALVDALESAPDDFRSRLLAGIGRRKDRSAVPALLDLFKKCSSEQRIDILDALLEIGVFPESEVVFPAPSLLSERDNSRLPDLWLKAADILRKEGKKEAARRYYEGVLNGAISDHLVCGALIGLAKLEDPSTLPIFGQNLSSKSWAIRGVAAKIVAEWPGEDVDRLLIDRFKEAGGEEQAALLKALVQRGAKELDEVLKEALDDEDEVVRITAIRELGERGDPSLASTFLKAAVEEGAYGKAARMAYLRLADKVLAGGNASQALSMYHQALSFTQDPDAIRKALSGISGLGNPQSVGKVRPLLENPSLAEEAARAYLALAKAIGDSGKRKRREEMIIEIIHHPNSGAIRNMALRQLKELGHDTTVFTKRQGFINSWWVIGPFPNDNNSAFGKSYFPEKEVDLLKGGEFNGKPMKWKHVETDEIPAKISLSQLFSKNQFVCAYAYVELEAPEDMEVLFLNGTNDGCEFFVNGEKLFETGIERGVTVDGDRIEATLKKGTNQVLLKVLQTAGGWEFCSRIADRDGNPIDLTKVPLIKE